MAALNGKSRCSICGKEKRAVRCEGCLQLFCYDHLSYHRQELNKQLDLIEVNRDLFRQALNEQRNHPQLQSSFKQIDRWEEESVEIIQQTANEYRQVLIQQTTKNIHQIEMNLSKLSDQLRKIRQENDFNEIDLNQFDERLKQLAEKLEKLSHVTIQPDSTPLIYKFSIIATPVKPIPPLTTLQNNTKWKQFGLTIAGGCGEGYQLNQLYWPYGICVDNEEQMIYIADYGNERVVKWTYGAKYGQVVAGGNGKGNRRDQLNLPTDVILDRKNDSLIVCDAGNRRVVRCSLESRIAQQIIISNIACSRITLDNNGDLYITDCEKNEVRRWKQGDTNGTLVAGGNGNENRLDQLNSPGYIFVDEEHSIYVSDSNNHRVMKWIKGATEGIIVAGGQGEGDSLTQLSNPQGVVVDQLGNVYVADSWNHRIMCWSKGSRHGSIVAGGNGQGEQANQFSCPLGLSVDRENNLYVVDWGNNRVQKFMIDTD